MESIPYIKIITLYVLLLPLMLFLYKHGIDSTFTVKDNGEYLHPKDKFVNLCGIDSTKIIEYSGLFPLYSPFL